MMIKISTQMIPDILLSSQNLVLHLTTAIHSHSRTLELVITNNLTPSTISISSILLSSHPLIFSAHLLKYLYSRIFFNINLFIYLFIFGCIGSSLLCMGFL